MVYKNVSIKRVIAKVFSDFDLQEGDHRISDMIEWGGQALEKIGAFPYFNNKVTGKDLEPILEVDNYQCKLPTDFHRLIQVSFSTQEAGPFYSVRAATGNMEHASRMNTDIENDNESSTDTVTLASDAAVINLAMSVYDITYASALTKINDEPATRALLEALLINENGGVANDSTTIDFVYVIQGDWIKLNVSSGYIMMSYQAIPTDLDGYPLVPDDAGFIEALYWYIAVKLLYPKWRDGRVRDAVYYDARRSWNFYCKQAYGNAMMPNQDQLESIKNNWLKLIPEINAHSNFFSTLGQQERIYNANR